MSHAATKWAFDQPELHRDMKPGEWAVLMVLADCHNPIHGCFPTQGYIASKTNQSDRTVREQLFRLRERGLINWEEAREGGRQGANRYALGFESDFQPEESSASPAGNPEHPQPEIHDTSSRKNLPPNLVREPVREPEPPPPPLPGGSAPSPSPDEDGWPAFEAAFTADGVPILRHGLAVGVWQGLDATQRALATEAARGYLAARAAEKRPGQKLAAQTFLREPGSWPGFARVPAPAAETASATVTIGAFDRAWWWLVFAWIGRHGAGLRDRGGAPAQFLANRLSLAIRRIGWGVPRGELDAIEAAALGLVKAHVDGPEFRAWRDACFARFGVTLPIPDATRWVYLPALDPKDWPAMAGELVSNDGESA